MPQYQQSSSINSRIKNKGLPSKASSWKSIEYWMGAPFRLLERIGGAVLAQPMNAALQRLDRMAAKLEGTKLKIVLQHLLFPLMLLLTLIIGYQFEEQGVTFASLTSLTLILFSYGLIFAPIERLLPYSKRWLSGGNDVSVDFMMFYSGIVWSILSKFVLTLLVIIHLIEWLEPIGRQWWPTSLPLAVQVFLFILLKDFFRYWYHRWMHEVPFMWRWHAVHHSVKRLYWMNGIRAHPLEILVQTLIWAVPLALLQPPEGVVMMSVLMSLSIGIFQHANIDAKLGFWEYIFSIGDNHRYHHYNTGGVGDCNYGGEFIVWDILFGTFYKPKGERPSENIGIGASPEYPQSMAGLMIAPFIPDQNVFGSSVEDPVDDGGLDDIVKD